MKKGILLFVLLLSLGGCLSEDQACVFEIEDRGDSEPCLYMLGMQGSLDSPNPEYREQAQIFISVMAPFCAKYILDLQACNKKSSVIPAKIW